MLPTIDLYNQHLFQTDKIKDVIAKGMLAAKLETPDLSAAEDLPQSPFRSSHFIS